MRPVVFGEILFDHFPDGSAVLGGAPFNVAWHLQALGSEPLLVSRVGTDAEGCEVLDAMAAWGMDRSGIQMDAEHPTGSVRVALHDGEPVFSIPPGQAYDFIAPAETLATAEPMAVYHGTLALRHPVSACALDALLAAGDPPVFVDVNLRAPWWRAERLPPLLARAAWIKLNKHELAELAGALGLPGFSPLKRARSLRDRCGARLVIVTCGADGAFAVAADGGEASVRPDVRAAVTDTVGAGDAFSAATVLGLLRGWPLALTLARAQSLAQAVCGLRGAVSRDPGFYQPFRHAWRAP